MAGSSGRRRWSSSRCSLTGRRRSGKRRIRRRRGGRRRRRGRGETSRVRYRSRSRVHRGTMDGSVSSYRIFILFCDAICFWEVKIILLCKKMTSRNETPFFD